MQIGNPVKCKRTYRAYDVNNLIAACKYVHDTKSSVRTTAKLFGVPCSTLGDRVSGKVSIEAHEIGSPRMLSHNEENSFVQHIIKRNESGNRYTHMEIANMVSEYLHAQGRLEKDRNLSKSWVRGLRRRFPELDVLYQNPLP